MLYFNLNPFEIIEDSVDGDKSKCLVQSKTKLSFGAYGIKEEDSQDILVNHIEQIGEAFKCHHYLIDASVDVINEQTTTRQSKQKEAKEHVITLWRPGYPNYYGDDGYWYDLIKTEIVDAWKDYPVVNKTVTITGVIYNIRKDDVKKLHKDNDYYLTYRRKEKIDKATNCFCAFFPILVLLITGLLMWAQAYGEIFLAQWTEYTDFFHYVFNEFAVGQPLFMEIFYFSVGTIWELLKYLFLILPFVLSFIAIFVSGKTAKRITKNVILTIISVALLIVQTQLIFTMYL